MFNPLSNPAYLAPPLLALVTSLILAAIVWRWAPKTSSRWLFCCLLLSVGLWGFLLFGMRASPDIYRALAWDRALSVAGFATFLLYYHFTITYTKTKRQSGILLVSYLLLAVVAGLSPTGLVIERMRLEHYGYAPVPGPLLIPLFGVGLLFMGGGIYNLLRRYKVSTSYDERNRVLYVVIAMLFPLSGALLDSFSNLPPAAVWGNLIFSIICTIAVVKYHLLDIRIVVRKSLVYLLLSVLVALPYVGILILLNHIFKRAVEPWWIHLIIILLLAIILRPLYSWAQKFVDRLFYRDRYDYLKALQQFSQKAQNIVNLKELSSTLTQLVSGALRTSSVYLLLPSESDNGFVIVSSTGLSSPPSGVVLRSRSPLIKWLKLQQCILPSEELDVVPQLQSLSLRERNNLEQIEAKLYVPIQPAPGQISGILVLGQKLSQQPYSSEDRQLLTALGSQMAIALENARLYNKSQQEVRERRRAEEALRESEEKYRALVENSPNLVAVYQDGHFKYVNKAACNRWGWTYEELTSPSSDAVEKVALEDSRHMVRKNIAKRLRGGYIHPYEIRMKTRDGAEFPVLVYGGAISYGGKPAIEYIFVDITERKRAEKEEQRLQQELYESGRLAAIGELAAGVAHEINNPLTAILGFSQRVLKKSHNENLTRDLERISGEALRAAKIVQNLLTFARRRKPEKEDCDTNDILQRALELRAYEWRTSNIKVVVDLAPDLPKVRADSHQIQEVFLNLILNAEQAMVEAHQGGTLGIKTCGNKGYVQIVFSDDGPGIAKENLSRIFHPFFSTRADKGGTGLGLSICHGIVAEHGGKIHAKSRLGEGATFIVELPVAASYTRKGKAIKKKPAKVN
jgi:two-component system NtrC family sensor kinase